MLNAIKRLFSKQPQECNCDDHIVPVVVPEAVALGKAPFVSAQKAPASNRVAPKKVVATTTRADDDVAPDSRAMDVAVTSMVTTNHSYASSYSSCDSSSSSSDSSSSSSSSCD